MHVTLTVKHARRDRALEDLFERERERIQRRLRRVPLGLVSLHCEIDLNTHLREGYASLTLNLPDGRLNARGVGPNILAALRDAVDDLLVELDKWRKRTMRERRGGKGGNGAFMGHFDELLDEIASRESEDTSKVIRQTLGELYPFVRRELDRHRRVLERPEWAVLDVADIVEDAVLMALSRRDEKPADVPFDRYLFTCAYEVILKEEEALRERAGSQSLEEEVLRPASREGPTSGEEIMLDGVEQARFFADVLPDASAGRSPESRLQTEDLRRALLRALRQLPDQTQRAVSLVAVEGLAEPEAARRLSVSEAFVRSALADARRAVQSEMGAHGLDD